MLSLGIGGAGLEEGDKPLAAVFVEYWRDARLERQERSDRTLTPRDPSRTWGGRFLLLLPLFSHLNARWPLSYLAFVPPLMLFPHPGRPIPDP